MYQIFTNYFYLISILKLFILSILAITTALWVLNSVGQTEESEHLARFSAPIYCYAAIFYVIQTYQSTLCCVFHLEPSTKILIRHVGS
jgi:DMSO/TMAO reductase YedYZ heme-binding membrane subunit